MKITKQFLTIFTILFFITKLAYAQTLDLSGYPGMFVRSDGTFNAIFVVGDYAGSGEVIAMSDIIVSLQQRFGNVGTAKLASEVCPGPNQCNLNQNIISVGSSCSNAVTSRIGGNPQDCTQGLFQGQGKINLYSYNGYAHIVVKGYSDVETRAAANALVNYQQNNLRGQEHIVITSEQKCTDSDSGENIYAYGEVTDIQNGVKRLNKDECILYYDAPKPNGDYAQAVRACSGEKCKLMEQICIRSNTAASLKEVPCQNGCKDGACIKEEGVPKPPYDLLVLFTDASLKYVKLTWKNVDGEKFYIYKNKNYAQFSYIGATTQKYFNDPDMLAGGIKYGYYVTAVNPNGESAPSNYAYVNQLKETKNSCMDSDGGKNYLVYGEVDGIHPQGYPFTFKDTCCNYQLNPDGSETCTIAREAPYISEAYCDYDVGGNLIPYVETAYKCPNGCRDGVCIEQFSSEMPLNNGLELYPKPFVKDGNLNTILVVGAKAPSSDVVALTDILNSLPSVTSNIGLTKLDTEVYSLNQNIISVGSPCVNSISFKIAGNPSDCTLGLQPGQGIIKIYTSKEGYSYILVTGYSDKETRDAANVLANYRKYNLKGDKYTLYQSVPISIQSCVDSDGGKSYNFKGSVKWLNYTDTDYCIDSTTLFEFYCGIDNTRDGETYYCQYGCSDGTCVQSSQEPYNNDGSQEIISKPIECQGCLMDNNNCISFGTRFLSDNYNYYCDITKNAIKQKENKEYCQNNYECVSNNCKSGLCASICEGCLNENRVCLPIGTRTKSQYCDIDYTFKNQKLEDIGCNNNYECSTNICVDNKCISTGLIQKIMEWFKRLFI
ncbi:hypothetical protein HY636_06150 [Candidatus Woesearchaeota archaeon]|nr:hypothetical protein [Candidatus Woesearchaeota archaeon]